MVRMLSEWKHSGFNVFFGNRISPKDDKPMENPARSLREVCARDSFIREEEKEHEGQSLEIDLVK
jgi:hypothetical protein